MAETSTAVQTAVQQVTQFLVTYSFDVLGAILILIIGFKVSQWTAKSWVRFGEQRHFDPTLTKFAAGAIKACILGFVLIVALNKFGITITPLVAAVGALAFGGSFAIQGPLSNYGAGLSILMTRPFVAGDTIAVAGVSGVVQDVKLACTILTTEDGELITIPNKHIVGEILRNSKGHHVVETTVGISYGDDPERGIAAVKRALASIPEVAKAPGPVVGIETFGDSAVTLGVRYWVPSAKYSQVLYAANLAIYRALKADGITMPFPQQDVHIISDATQVSAR